VQGAARSEVSRPYRSASSTAVCNEAVGQNNKHLDPVVDLGGVEPPSGQGHQGDVLQG